MGVSYRGREKSIFFAMPLVVVFNVEGRQDRLLLSVKLYELLDNIHAERMSSCF